MPLTGTTSHGQTSFRINLNLPQQTQSRFGVDTHSHLPWPTAFVPSSIIPSRKKTAGSPLNPWVPTNAKVPAQTISI